ncbi:uncharacterized protein MYCFIDRAFT_170522 [Pseudocercospora fijiensis CIRAD86]|uniref:Uncharacterized protein n=1 Tax=Pseudocercospora fijiensis (strain CIRAD86) TaxID=383855 RepID=N1QC91_PSEFD|nr:uncharacterized protein MYCFIDRAFT_170522 [Pseudocercospora fijiensis CIRAD86]EME88973.1 hypothetical protein MYCFIDRAFT_170522 [Pseudocercospora fijiensis CIRAD86]
MKMLLHRNKSSLRIYGLIYLSCLPNPESPACFVPILLDNRKSHDTSKLLATSRTLLVFSPNLISPKDFEVVTVPFPETRSLTVTIAAMTLQSGLKKPPLLGSSILISSSYLEIPSVWVSLWRCITDRIDESHHLHLVSSAGMTRTYASISQQYHTVAYDHLPGIKHG